MEMGKKILMFGDIEIEKYKFYHHKSPILLEHADIEKVLVSNKISSGEKSYKYFIGYSYNNHKVKPSHNAKQALIQEVMMGNLNECIF